MAIHEYSYSMCSVHLGLQLHVLYCYCTCNRNKLRVRVHCTVLVYCTTVTCQKYESTFVPSKVRKYFRTFVLSYLLATYILVYACMCTCSTLKVRKYFRKYLTVLTLKAAVYSCTAVHCCTKVLSYFRTKVLPD